MLSMMLLFLFIFTGTVQSKLLILPNLLRRLSKHVLRIEEISVCSPPQCDSVPFSLTRNHLSVQLVWSYCYRRLLSVIMSWFFGKTLRSMGRKMNQTTYIWLCPSEVMTLLLGFSTDRDVTGVSAASLNLIVHSICVNGHYCFWQ